MQTNKKHAAKPDAKHRNAAPKATSGELSVLVAVTSFIETHINGRGI
tara:strand:- start:147 stop:287 length:141 start_codon:yes stop_codon:yes gene_type:complete